MGGGMGVGMHGRMGGWDEWMTLSPEAPAE